MKKGKITESVLQRSVLRNIHTQRNEVIKGAGIGSDCAFFRYKETEAAGMAVSTETITLPLQDAGHLAVMAAVNNLAAGGAKCFAVTLSLTMPEDEEESRLQAIMKQIENTCRMLQVQIAGGHTEVSESVRTPIVTVTAFGKSALQKSESKKKKAPGLDVVMTKWIGLEGTMILAKEKENALLTRYPLHLLTSVCGFEKYLSVLPEAAAASEADIYAMHDVRNGGIFGGLWEFAKIMETGLTIDLKKIPVKQETIEICEFFDLNPYELLSGGCLLLAAEDGEALVQKLEKEGIFSTIIGKTTDSNDKILLNEEEVRFLEPAKSDEIFKISWI